LGEAKEQEQQTNDPTSILLDFHVHVNKELIRKTHKTASKMSKSNTYKNTEKEHAIAVAVSFKEILLISDFNWILAKKRKLNERARESKSNEV